MDGTSTVEVSELLTDLCEASNATRAVAEPEERSDHIALRLGNCILVTGGIGEQYKPLSFRTIWLYDLYKLQWAAYVLPPRVKRPGSRIGASAVVIGKDVYMFGGHRIDQKQITNELWKLSKTDETVFRWQKHVFRLKKKAAPFPRMYHTSWEYGSNLWVFGGFGPSPRGYLYSPEDSFDGGDTNQLLCVNSMGISWKVKNCQGEKPSPRSNHATARIQNKVWLFGGTSERIESAFDDLYELNLDSLVWSQIKGLFTKPCGRQDLSLTALSENKLVLNGGTDGKDETYDDTWIFHGSSRGWEEMRSAEAVPRQHHKAVLGLENEIIVTGGEYFDENSDREVCPDFVRHLYTGESRLKISIIRTIHHIWSNYSCLIVFLGLCILLAIYILF